MAHKNDFLFRDEYEYWLESVAGIKPGDSLACYVRQDKFEGMDIPVFEIAANFMLKGEPIYAYSALEMWEETVKQSDDKNLPSYFARIYEFFLRNESVLMKSEKAQTLSELQLSEARRKLNKRKIFAQIDGMDSLINALGEDNFVKLVVESSFFFEPMMVKAQFNDLVRIYNNGGELYARKSSYYHPGSRPKVKVIEDSNGNSQVYKTIKELFGFELNKTIDKKSILNNIVSHVWGNATDPRYFTALWNVLLIPAWANHLMDKPTTDGDISSKLQSTIKEICIRLYGLDDFNWADMILESNKPKVNCKKDILKGKYEIRVINRICQQNSYAKFGKIEIKTIQI